MRAEMIVVMRTRMMLSTCYSLARGKALRVD
jgi:hypothetical protein